MSLKLWGGRFTKETDKLVNDFNASITFDKRMYAQDITGSIAHAKMLGKQNIIEQDEADKIIKGLESIKADIDSGKLEITDEYEDIHSFVEATLISRIGDTGKRLHTGRSRNDQVALDTRMYFREQCDVISELLKGLQTVLLRIIKENTDTYMPGFTHLQKAQPVTLAHHFAAYFDSGGGFCHRCRQLCEAESRGFAGAFSGYGYREQCFVLLFLFFLCRYGG